MIFIGLWDFMRHRGGTEKAALSGRRREPFGENRCLSGRVPYLSLVSDLFFPQLGNMLSDEKSFARCHLVAFVR